MNNRNFTEVQGGSNNERWKPQANEKNGMQFNPANPYNVREGYFVETREVNGKDGTFEIATFRPVNPDGSFGEDFDVTKDAVLSDRLSKVKINSYVRLEYQGRMHKKGYPANSPWSQTNSYHIWKVLVDENAVPLNANTAAPFTAAVQQPQGQVFQQQQGAPVFNQGQVNQQQINQQGNQSQNVFHQQNQNFPQQGQAGPFSDKDELPF